MRKITTFGLMALVAFGITLTLSFVFELFGFSPYLKEQGIHYESLFAFCMIFGFAGAFISLFLSKWMVKRSLRIQLLNSQSLDPQERWLFQSVKQLADRAGLPKTPEVGIYSSPEMNAFATGPSRSDSLVAVSTGLLASMNRDEVEGVLAHEVAHIANGDMVRMTLLQGVINALVMFLARIVAHVIVARFDSRQRFMIFFMVTMLFQMVFGILGAVVVNTYSRRREFRADEGGASLAGRGKMLAALEALKDRSKFFDKDQPQLASMKISGNPKGFARLLMTHPPLEDRIEFLKRGA
jgi:heat shock protein HtpX